MKLTLRAKLRLVATLRQDNLSQGEVMSIRNSVAVVWANAVAWWVLHDAFEATALLSCAVLATAIAIIITVFIPNDTDDEASP